MPKVLILFAGAAAAVAAAPAAAQHRAAPAAPGYHRSGLEAALSARLQSIQVRIDLLREEGLMDSDQARELRQQSRALERRLIGLSARDSSDVELAIRRLQDRLRFAGEDARWGRSALEQEQDDRFQEQEDRYERERDRERDEHRLDRHIAPPFDRWDDPFDDGM